TSSRTVHKMSEVQECLSSSDEEPADVYRSSQLLSSVSNLDLPGNEVYRLAINSVGRSSAHRAEGELNSDASNDADATGGQQLPSLVNAEEDVADDWLVNDIQWPQAKRKSSAVTSVLTTDFSRSTAKKRFRKDLLTNKSDQASKRLKYPASDGDRQRARASFDDTRSDVSRTGGRGKHDSFCAVSSTTEMVPHVDELNQPGSSRESEFEWGSDDDLLCQIDTVYDTGNQSVTEIPSSHNDSMSSSPVVTSSPRTSKEIPLGHILQPKDGRLATAGYFQSKPSTQFDDNYRNGFKEAMQILNGSVQVPNGSDNRNVATGCGQDSITEKFEKPTYINSIRVKVRIGQQTLLIPIQPADQDKNISWLFQQVKERYFSMFLMLPTLTLSTQDGIILDSDVLTANVSAWERPRLEDRYTQACKLCLTNANSNIVSSLQKADQSGQLHLSDLGLGLSFLQPVFQALEDHKVLTDLRVNGNRLGDAGVESLMKLLPSLPHLKILSLETNGISADGVQTMAAALKTDPCLQHLSSLSLSHNCLDDIAAEALACVVKSLPNLSQLSLCSCNFSRKLFDSSLGEALKVRRIEHLNISENNLGPEGIKDLLLGLEPAYLSQLNVSHTCSLSGQEIFPYLQNFVSGGVCCLQELFIAGNHLSPADVTFINRLPVLIKSLRCLVLSQNQSVNNKSLQKLLYLSADKDSSLREITARGCSVTSPLESELLDALRNKMSSSVPLKKFVFTCRGLKIGDSQLLEGIWNNTWKDQGQVKADGMTVFMTVV
ncbi:unnamed protein product, partial [Candidula unifasciata]